MNSGECGTGLSKVVLFLFVIYTNLGKNKEKNSCEPILVVFHSQTPFPIITTYDYNVPRLQTALQKE
jgi:hypothetical protein